MRGSFMRDVAAYLSPATIRLRLVPRLLDVGNEGLHPDLHDLRGGLRPQVSDMVGRAALRLSSGLAVQILDPNWWSP